MTLPVRALQPLVSRIARASLTIIALGIVVALVLGALVTSSPLVAFFPLSVLGFTLLARYPAFRLVFVLFGAMLVFQSSQGVSTIKLIYMVGLALITVMSLLSVRSMSTARAYELLKPLLGLSLFAIIGLVMSFAISATNGITVSNWIRDISTYGLLAVVPFIALDAQRIQSAKVLESIMVSFGLLSSVAVGVGWAARRGLLELPLDRFLLPTAAPAYALVFYSFAKYLTETRDRSRWLFCIGVVTVMLVLTGSRSAFVAYLGLIPIAFLAGGSVLATVGRSMSALVTTLAVFLAFLYMVMRSAVVDVTGLTDRFSSIGTFLADPWADPSFVDRAIQTKMAWNLFLEHPLLGTGPGYVFVIFRPASNIYTESLSMDTSVIVLAKFGLIGAAILIAAALALRNLALEARAQAGGRNLHAVITGWVLMTVVALPLSAAFEDKGYSLALMVLLGTGLRHLHTTGPIVR